MTLEPIGGIYAIARLDPVAPLPTWAAGSFVSLTRTADELSIVCAENAVPAGVKFEGGWLCLRVQGPIPFETTGIASSLTGALANAGISVFFVSTYDTDYLLVKQPAWDRACEALTAAGHTILNG